LPLVPRGDPVPEKLPGEPDNDYWERMNRDYPLDPNREGAVLWPTPQHADSERHSLTMKRGNPTLLGAASLWPTPNVPNGGRKPADTTLAELVANRGMTASGKRQVGLENAASLWPTPRAYSFAESHTPSQVALDRQAREMWTTPTSHDVKGRMSTNRKYPGLPDDVALWRTPTSGKQNKGAGQLPEKRLAGGHTLDLQDQVHGFFQPSHQAQQSAMPGRPSSPPPPTLPLLSPLFTEWLMDLPCGWTALSVSPRLAIPSYLCAQRSLLSRLLASSGLTEEAA
jgi:hypothetical protein